MLCHYNEDKAKPLSTLMVVRSLDAKRCPFRPKEDDEEILEPEVPYLSAIGALLYLVQCTRPNISFTINLLIRYSNAPTRRHWTGVKDISATLRVLLISTCSIPTNPQVMPQSRVNSCIVGYADVGLSNGLCLYRWRHRNLLEAN